MANATKEQELRRQLDQARRASGNVEIETMSPALKRVGQSRRGAAARPAPERNVAETLAGSSPVDLGAQTSDPAQQEQQFARDLNDQRRADQQPQAPQPQQEEVEGQQENAPGNRMERAGQSVRKAFDKLRPSTARQTIEAAQNAAATAQQEAASAAANKAWTFLWQKAHVTLETFVEDFKILTGPASIALFGVRILGQFFSPTISRGGVTVRLIPKLGMKEWIVRIVANLLSALVVGLELLLLIAIAYVISTVPDLLLNVVS
jgi:hypothetical protein